MNNIAEKYINNTLDNFEVRLVCLVVYNETEQKYCTSQNDIRKQITEIIEKRFRDIANNPILNRITYIIMPIWKLEELASEFQNKI